MVRIIIFTVLSVLACCKSANILVVLPFTSPSHYIFLRPIGLELARRGHNITTITPFEETEHPATYHQVILPKTEIWELCGNGTRSNVFETVNMSSEEFNRHTLYNGGFLFTEHILKLPVFQDFLARDLTFDAVIVEQFYLTAFNILAHKYQAPLILVTPFGNCMRHNAIIGNPMQQSTVVHEYLMLENAKIFWGRLRNLYFSALDYMYFYYWYLPKHESLVKKYMPNLPEPVPSLYEIEENASLTMYNTHFSFDPPTAYLPNVIEIGGMHLSKSDGKLPADLQKILDEALHGVVYVNFGSNVRSSELPAAKRDAFLNVFKKLKQIVIWKWEDETLTDIPKNVVIRKWLPQKEILSHPNINVFISHGGLIGTEEAIFHGVPIIGIPIYADQFNNVLQIQDLGMGKILLYNDINENILETMLLEVLNNKSYAIKAKELSKRYQDRPITALDNAAFWIEYVIRHKGAEFMKSHKKQMGWIAYHMLDVYALILLVSFLSLVGLYSAVLFFISLRKGSSRIPNSLKKNN